MCQFIRIHCLEKQILDHNVKNIKYILDPVYILKYIKIYIECEKSCSEQMVKLCSVIKTQTLEICLEIIKINPRYLLQVNNEYFEDCLQYILNN